MARRRARSAVLALLLLSFVGPWEGNRAEGPTYFWEVVGNALRWHRAQLLLVAAVVALPISCLAATLAPASRPRTIIYRVLAGAMAALFGLAAVPAFFRPREFIGVWGMSLYLVALLLGLTVELIPARRTPKRDYGEVFR